MSDTINIYFKIAYTTTSINIPIPLEWTINEFITNLTPILKNQLLINSNFEFVEINQQILDENGNLLPSEEGKKLIGSQSLISPLWVAFYIRLSQNEIPQNEIPQNEIPQNENECIICRRLYTNIRLRMFNPNCMHLCCMGCYYRLSNCHICRGPLYVV